MGKEKTKKSGFFRKTAGLYSKLRTNYKSIKWPKPKEALKDSGIVLGTAVFVGTLISMSDTVGKLIVGMFM